MRRYLYSKKLLFSVLLLFISINVTISIAVAFLLKFVIDAANAQDKTALEQSILLCFCYAVIYFVLSFLTGVLEAKYKKAIMVCLKNDIFESVMGFTIVQFSKNNSGEYISTLNNDVKTVEENYVKNFLECYENILLLLFAVVSIFFINPYVAIMAILLSLLPLTLPSVFGKKLGALQGNYVEQLGKYNEKIKDFFGGFEVLKSFHVENRALQNHNIVNTECEQSKYLLDKTTALVNSFGGVISLCVQFSIFLISGYFVISGSLSIGAIVAITQLSGNVVAPLMNLTQCNAKFKAVKAVNEKLMGFIKSEKTRYVSEGNKQFNEGIEYRNVSFSYDGCVEVLKDINLTMEKGKKYAVVGGSGSGKSTLLNLLLGYYDTYKGSILLDGDDIKKSGAEGVNRFCSVIHQNVFVFDDTIKNNITLYNNYKAAELEKSIEQSGLKTFISSSPDGLDTVTGESGNRFSGGERQRIAIARALIKGNDLLVMDEATANLDNETAYHVEKSLLEISDLTCAVVTHRYNKELLKMYDKIFVLKNGRLHESGSFDELLLKKEYFYSLYSIAN